MYMRVTNMAISIQIHVLYRLTPPVVLLLNFLVKSQSMYLVCMSKGRRSSKRLDPAAE